MEISKELLQKILDALPVHLYWTGKDTRIAGANLLQAKNFGDKDVNDCIGKNAYDFAKQLGWSKEFADQVHQEHLYVINTGDSSTNEYTGVLANGEKCTYLSYKYPLKINNEIVGLVGISVDITDRKRQEQELKLAKEQSEIANQTKTQFIQNMEHDLRTPCSGISGMMKILEEREKDPEKKEILGQLHRASEQLLDILNNILKFDVIDSNKLPILSKKFSIKKVLDNLKIIMKPSSDAKKLQFIDEFDDRIPEILLGDEHRVFRILLNLVGNAIKFTVKGYVRISIVLERIISDSNRVVLKIIVKDTGIGIPKDKQQIIYERFSKVTPSNKGIYKGSGLGLSIVKQFIDDLEGEIEVDSGIGQGAIFTCLFSFKVSLLSDLRKEKNKSERKLDKRKLGKNIKILLVEDDSLAQRVAGEILANITSNELDIVSTGKEALDLIAKKEYGLIFMDIGLPDIDGFEVTKIIRQTVENEKTLVIALTAHDLDLIYTDGIKVGVNDFLMKPLDAKKVESIIEKWFTKSNKSEKPNEIKLSSEEVNKEIKNSKSIDKRLGVKLAGGNAKLAQELLAMLVNDLPNRAKKINEFYELKKMDDLSKEAHKLRGAACYCGTPRLKELAKELELIAKTTDFKKIESSYIKFIKELNTILTTYKS